MKAHLRVGDADPQGFDEALNRAQGLLESGASIRVLYTEEASQTEITSFVRCGIPTELLSGA